ncbi:MAG: hypothetical protein GXO85_08585 [Chlorobi bacterium]|nr:hypothetical protein [Chlorobiota bacterium]
MKRTFLLFGAGASIEFGAPSTSLMSEKIENYIKLDEWAEYRKVDNVYQEIKLKLSKYLSSDEAVNFENIYHCVHELLQFVPHTEGAVDEYKFLLQPFISSKDEISPDSLRTLEQTIIKAIYNTISDVCAAPVISLDPFSMFLKLLKKQGVLRAYTTNYDDFPLQASPDFYTGFDEGNAVKFNPKYFWRKGWDTNSLFHLHGSIHFGFPHGKNFDIGEIAWFDDRAEALKYSAFNGTAERRMDGSTVERSAILTGLDKLSRIQSSPLNYYYAGLAQDLMSCDQIIIVGSGYGDLHLNSWLKQARLERNSIPIILVDYYSSGFSRDFDYSRKSIEIFHTLGISAFDRKNVIKRGEHWYISRHSNAAIWDGGFKLFLENMPEFQSVFEEIQA